MPTHSCEKSCCQCSSGKAPGVAARAKAVKKAQAIRASGWVENRRKKLNNRKSPLRVDPTRLTTLRRQFRADLQRRFALVQKALVTLLVKDDAFELLNQRVFNVENAERFFFQTTPQKVNSFKNWLKRLLKNLILDEEQEEDNQWFQRYVEEGLKKGAGRAFDDTRPQVREWLKSEAANEPMGFYAGTRAEFLNSSFNRPVAVEKVKLLAGRVFTDLKGISDQMSAKLTRGLTDGLVQGQNPRVIARNLSKDVSISLTRSKTIAQTEITRCHAEGQLLAFKNLGVVRLGVMAEWQTAGDSRVCELCEALDDTVMTVDEAEGLLPRHPNCRCAWVPANVGEDEENQVRGKDDIEDAIQESVDLEGDKTTWPGADISIAKKRPEGIFNQDVENANTFFADCERDSRGRCLPAGGLGRVATAEHYRIQRLAKKKARNAPTPTKKDIAIANRLMDKLGAARYESNLRGSSYSRRAARANLLKEFGDGKTCGCVYCGKVLDDSTITRDKILTAREGGRYTLANTVPACLDCNQSRGDTSWKKIKWPLVK